MRGARAYVAAVEDAVERVGANGGIQNFARGETSIDVAVQAPPSNVSAFVFATITFHAIKRYFFVDLTARFVGRLQRRPRSHSQI